MSVPQSLICLPASGRCATHFHQLCRPPTLISPSSCHCLSPLRLLPPPLPPPPPRPSCLVRQQQPTVCPSLPAPASTSQPGKSPLLVFSHGSTQVDTFVPSSQCLQRTLYSLESAERLQHQVLLEPSSYFLLYHPVLPGGRTTRRPQRVYQQQQWPHMPGRCGIELPGPFLDQFQLSHAGEAVARAQRRRSSSGGGSSSLGRPPVRHQSSHATQSHYLGNSDLGVKGLEVRVTAPHDVLADGARRRRFPLQHQAPTAVRRG